MAAIRIFSAATLAVALVATATAPADAARRAARHAHASRGGGWEGTWSGAWGGNDPTAITVSGNRVVSYQYNGQTNPVASSRVTPTRISYGENGVVVTVTKTGANTAHATIHTGQGDGTAELTRH